MFAQSDVLPALPILVPFITAIFCILAYQNVRVQKVVSVVGSAAAVVAAVVMFVTVQSAGVQSLQMSDWDAPFGISIVADPFSVLMELLTASLGLLVVIFSLRGVDDRRARYGYYALVQLLLMGVSGAFITGDMFNLYVWFEVMLTASFVLLALGGEKQQIKGALKYVTLNLIASVVFLTSLGVLYGFTGTLNMADLARFMPSVPPGGALLLAVMFGLTFSIKAGMFPLFFWLPDAYHTPPLAVTTIFSGLLTKVGVYAMVRVFTLVFAGQMAVLQTPLLVLAALTMVIGVLGAVAQYDVRRLLSFHIISQIGYLLMGLALFTNESIAALIFFLLHVVAAKSGLFLAAGLVHRLTGTYDLHKLGGMWKARPWLSLVFVLPALALAGLPPFSGFWAKLMLVQAGLNAGQYWIVAVSLGVSMLTLYSMVKIWNECYWKDAPAGGAGHGVLPLTQLGPAVGLGVVVTVLGLGVGWVYPSVAMVAEQLLAPAAYIAAVLGGG